MLPNFLIIGTMKGGTTSLYSYLRSHPDVSMSTVKELNFFSNDQEWSKGQDWYSKKFSNESNASAVGEASVNYTKFPYYHSVPERISSLLPEGKFIYMMRSPIERIYSHYLHNLYADIEPLPLEQAIRQNPLYIQTSQYYSQIEQYLKYFPKERFLFLFLEKMRESPLETVQQVYSFLGIDANQVPPGLHTRRHQTKDKKGKDNMLLKGIKKLPFYKALADSIPDSTKKPLGKIFKTVKVTPPDFFTDEFFNFILSQLSDDLEKLKSFLGDDLDFWDLQKR